MYGMSGNLSVRLSSDPISFTITPSGINKGHLSEKDLITIKDGRLHAAFPARELKGIKTAIPSSETLVHQAIYRALPGAGAVFHVHPIYSTLISKLFGDPNKVRMLKVEGVMMMKGMIGLKEENSRGRDYPELAGPGAHRTGRHDHIQSSERALPAVLVYDHGLTGWGATPEQARNHLEIIEYTCQYLFSQPPDHTLNRK